MRRAARIGMILTIGVPKKPSRKDRYRYDDDDDDDYRHAKRYKRKRGKSILSEIFDFDCSRDRGREVQGEPFAPTRKSRVHLPRERL